jgi:eukaryotic-like serine/threonine-protein kinase
VKAGRLRKGIRALQHDKIAGFMIGKTLGRYQIYEKIGGGGWGDVYRARDERLDRDVAIKVLTARALEADPSRKRFRKEAHVLSRLNHPNIATILDFDTQEGLDFLVMEYITGTTLQEMLSNKRLSEKEIVQISLQIAAALEEAHQVGIVHRDLKPNNIIVTPKGQVKVLDFGLAKLLQPPPDQQVALLTTETNLVIGTVPYMSPEQLRTEPLDGRSDIYSFGVTLYEMATGQRPHTESQPVSLVDAILHKSPPPPIQIRQELSPRLQEIILKCLEKDAENRYQSIQDLQIDLRRLSTPSMFTEIESKVRPRRRIQWRKISLNAGIPVVVLIALLLGLYISDLKKTAPVQKDGLNIDSIVALPSKVYGSEENKFLSDAIPNALSTHLSQIQGLDTKLPPTNVEMERLDGDLTKLANAYGVKALIATSVTADQGRFVLNVQLIEAGTRRLLWSRDYDGQRDNYLQLVRSAAEGLRTALYPSASPIQTAASEKRSTDAELVFQRGFFHMRSYVNLKRNEDFDGALSDLEHALKLDPTNARAAAGIARLYVAKLESGAPLREVLPEIDKWAYQALKLDHRCGEAWQVLSVAEEMRPNSDKRKRIEYSLKAATYANQSGYSHHVLGVALSSSSFVLAVEASREGTRQEPLHLTSLLYRAGILTRQGNPKEALKLIDRVLSMEHTMPMGELMKVWVLLRDHQYEESEKWIPKLDKNVAERRLHPGWVDFARDWLEFEKSASRQDKEQVSAALQRLVSMARGEAPPFPRWEVVTGNVIGIQAKHDSTAATLETLSLRAERGILEPYDWLILSPELETIRKDPQFKTIVARSRKEFEEMMSILEEARSRKELPSYLEKPLADMRKLL